MGMPAEAVHELLARAVERIDEGFPTSGLCNDNEGRNVGGALTPIRCAGGSGAAGVRARVGDVTRARGVVRLARSNTQQQYRRPQDRRPRYAWEQFARCAADNRCQEVPGSDGPARGIRYMYAIQLAVNIQRLTAVKMRTVGAPHSVSRFTARSMRLPPGRSTVRLEVACRIPGVAQLPGLPTII